MGNYNWGRAVVGLSIVFRVRRIPGTVEVSGAAETTDTTLRPLTRSAVAKAPCSYKVTVILRSVATKDLLSRVSGRLQMRDIRSFADPAPERSEGAQDYKQHHWCAELSEHAEPVSGFSAASVVSAASCCSRNSAMNPIDA